ncbi:MAG: PepSY-associated TM helix domain-containing protein [Pseudomonadota bacterium]
MSKIAIADSFRASMNWLHTWAGIGVSCLLFAIFWMGSLSVFDREIDQWMKPEMRISASAEAFRYGPLFDALLDGEAKDAAMIFVDAPGERDPLAYVVYQTSDGARRRGYFDPATHQHVDLTDSYAGTGFFYPFHYSLHIPAGIGDWVVGFCAMAMLVLIVSGIFIHRKIVQDFFTFRPKKALRRSTLDLHNLSSLVALPLHILFPLTGLMIFFSTYFPWSYKVVYQGEMAPFARDLGEAVVEKSGDPLHAEIDMDVVVARAEARWAQRSAGAKPKADSVGLQLINDANAYVLVREVFPSRAVSRNKNILSVSIVDGEVLAESAAGPAQSSFAWLVGAHYIQFDSWALRWLYFAGGLLGSLMIASGLIFWMQSRIRKGVVEPRSISVVRGLAVGSISGIILASGAFLVVNRLLPESAHAFGLGRASLEVLVFYSVWVLTFAHAAIRDKAAWAEQAWAIATIGVAAVLLNWATTGDHLARTIGDGLWAIAGMDLVLFGAALVSVWTALHLKKREILETSTPMRSSEGERGKAQAE